MILITFGAPEAYTKIITFTHCKGYSILLKVKKKMKSALMEKILYEIIPDLALAAGGDSGKHKYDLKLFLNSFVNVFIDKLQCSDAFVQWGSHQGLNVIWPDNMIENPEALFPDLPLKDIPALALTFKASKYHVTEKDQVFYLFLLSDQGYFIISRQNRFDEGIPELLERVFGILANTCETIAEVERLRITEDTLKQERNLLRTIIDNIPDPVYVKDLEGRKILLNKAEAHLLSASTVEEVIGKSDADFYPADVAEKTHLEDQKVIQTLTANIHLEGMVITKEGEEIWFDGNKIPYFDSQGNVLGIVGISHNITNRIKAEREIKETAAKYQSIFNSFIDLYYRSDLQGNILVISPSVYKLAGYRPEELIGKKVDLVYLDIESREKMIQLLIKKGSINDYENVLLKKDGSRVAVSITSRLISDADGKPQFIEGSIRDISQRKETDEKLAKLLHQQSLITQLASGFINIPLDSSDMAVDKLLALAGEQNAIDRVYIFAYDFISHTMSNTHEWCANGVTPEKDKLQDIPMDLFTSWVKTHEKGEILTVPDVSKLDQQDVLRQMLEPQGIKTLITVPMVLEGECLGFVGFDSVKTVKDWSKEEITLLVLLADMLCNVADRKRSEEALKKVTEEAQAASVAKTRFLANMSHEIRTPLNAIIGMVRLLLESSVTSPQLKLLHNMKTSSETLLSIINDILDFSKIESGQIEIEKTDFNPRELFRRIYDANEYRAEEKGIKLSYLTDERMHEVLKGDPVHLHQILNNLVSNAIKFTQKGMVELRCELTGDENGKQSIFFLVEDTGIGISPENQKKIFQSFQQEDESITRTYGGTGLGLAISKQLVELMGGILSVESAKNTGSKFYFTLEFEAGSLPLPEHDQKAVSEETHSLRGIRVLLVEDNKFNQFIAQAMLEKWDAKTELCEDGQQAVDKLRDATFDLILMDIQMPVMDGITASTVIRKELKLNTPILALTANVVMGIVDRCKQAGMQGYVSKPFDEDELYEKIEMVLQESNEGKEPVQAIVEQLQLADVSRLLKMVGSDTGMLKKMISKFLEVTPEYIRDLSEASGSRDADAIQRSSHRLKSAIDLVSNDIMRDLIKDVNDRAKTGKLSDELFEQVEKFLNYYLTLAEQLKAY